MSRSPQYMQGRREAIKWAITWLHKRSEEMNDPHAQATLNAAAFNMGADSRDGQLPKIRRVLCGKYHAEHGIT